MDVRIHQDDLYAQPERKPCTGNANISGTKDYDLHWLYARCAAHQLS